MDVKTEGSTGHLQPTKGLQRVTGTVGIRECYTSEENNSTDRLCDVIEAFELLKNLYTYIESKYDDV